MTTTTLAQRARAAGARLGPWLFRRVRERSTWIGLAAVAAALGQSVLADHLTRMADVLPMILGAGGAAIAAATTSQHPAPAEPSAPQP